MHINLQLFNFSTFCVILYLQENKMNNLDEAFEKSNLINSIHEEFVKNENEISKLKKLMENRTQKERIGIDGEHISLMREQLAIMKRYSNILDLRKNNLLSDIIPF